MAAVVVEVCLRGASSTTPRPSCGACCCTFAVVTLTRRVRSCVAIGGIVRSKEWREIEEEGDRRKVRVMDLSMARNSCFFSQILYFLNLL